MWELASVKSVRQAGNSSKNRCCSLESKGSLEAEFLPLLGTSVFSLQAFNWLHEAHPHYRVICFTQSLLIWMLITSKKNSFTASSRIVFEQTTVYHSLTKLTHKINHHNEVQFTYCKCTHLRYTVRWVLKMYIFSIYYLIQDKAHSFTPENCLLCLYNHWSVSITMDQVCLF